MGGEGQGGMIAARIDRVTFTGFLAQRNSVGAQVVALGEADLEGVETEDISDLGIDTLLLPGGNVAALCRIEPGIESRN